MSEKTGPRSRHPLAEHVDEQRVRAAIDKAEASTTGKIHVTLSHRPRSSTLAAAEHAFKRQRLTQTPQRNGVLFLVVPASREFAVVGDVGIHARAGQEFWDRVVSRMSALIKSSNLTEGLVQGIEVAGEELGTHFPREPGSANSRP